MAALDITIMRVFGTSRFTVLIGATTYRDLDAQGVVNLVQGEVLRALVAAAMADWETAT